MNTLESLLNMIATEAHQDIHPDCSDYGFCRECGMSYEVHTPFGWANHGNMPIEKSEQIKTDWEEFESPEPFEHLGD